ncbi:hypothetical protein MCEMIH16_03404 [Caulobacteraceae bacterium]|jgi:hypothetical protein
MIGFISLVLLSFGTVWWGWCELKNARSQSKPTMVRRVALYYSLVLFGMGWCFAALGVTRMWPDVPPWLALIGLVPLLLIALAVRFSRGFAVRLLPGVRQ